MKRNIWVKIHGRVNSVGFGSFSREAATSFGIKGSIDISDESTAIIEAEGDNKSLGYFIQKITQGDLSEKIESLEIRNGILRNYPFFRVMFNQKEVKNGSSIVNLNGLFLP